MAILQVNSRYALNMLGEYEPGLRFAGSPQKAELQLYGKIEQDRTSSIPDDI